MTGFAHTTSLERDLLVRPTVALAAGLLVVLSIINALAPSTSQASVKTFFVAAFSALLFFLSLHSLRYLLYFFTGGAIIQGFGFLVPPTALEQKHFFSNFYLQFGSVKMYLSDCFLLVALCVIPLSFLTGRFPSIKLRKSGGILTASVALFIAYGMAMAIWSVRAFGKSALGESRTILYGGLFFVAALAFRSRPEILAFLRFLVGATLVRTFLNTVTVIVSPAYLAYRRPFGSNSDAAYCAVSLLLLFALQEHLIGPHLARRFAQVWLMLFPILITSRSTILCLLIVLMLKFAVCRNSDLKRMLIWVAVAVVVLCACIAVVVSIPALNDLFTARFASLVLNYQNDPTGNWRLLGWLYALESIIAHPLFGIGLGGYAERFIDGEWVKVSLHSAYLDYLYCLGLVGLTLFLATIISGLAATVRKYRGTEEGIERRLVLGLLLVLFFLILFIALNAEMAYALTGTVMWIFLGLVPFACSESPPESSGEEVMP